MTADLNFFQNAEKSVCAKAFGNNNRIKIPANQVCPRITDHGRRARIEANEFRSDRALLVLTGVIRGRAGKTATDRAGDDSNKDEKESHSFSASFNESRCVSIIFQLPASSNFRVRRK